MADIGINWELVNEAVATWARTYSHNLVNGINTTTSRKLTRAIIDFSESPDMTMNQLTDRIAPIFGADRASNIAITETTRAYALGNKEAWAQSKVTEGVRWNTANDELVCPICGPLNQQTVEIGGMFPGNIDNPPAHPRCRCWLTPVVDMGKLETDIGDIQNIELAGIGRDVYDPFAAIRPPDGRAPRGMGEEYQTRRWIVKRLQTQHKFRSQLQHTVNNYRGQIDQQARITQATLRIQEIDKATEAILQFAGQDTGAEWSFIKEVVTDILDVLQITTESTYL